MKKWISLFLSFCLIVSLASCGRLDNTDTTGETDGEISEVDTHGFARVMESDSNSLFVCGFTSLGYAGVSLPRGVDGKDFQVGDYVKIAYGDVCETYPVFVTAVTIRHLTEKEIDAVYEEETVRGEYVGTNEDGVLLRHSGGTYIVPVENLDNVPMFEEGAVYEVRFDGILFDRMLGYDEKIYFPISISRVEEDMILPGGTYRFTAEIRKITDTYLEVYTEDENMRRTSELFRVSIPEGADVYDFSVGDAVEIVFAGAIEELYPANIKGTVSIELWRCDLAEADG